MHVCRECRMPTSGSICHRCRERRDNTCRRCSRRLRPSNTSRANHLHCVWCEGEQ